MPVEARELVGNFLALINHGEVAFRNRNIKAYEESIRFCGKILRELAHRNELDLALRLEPLWYNKLVKKVETEEHYFLSFSYHKEAFQLAGRRYGEGFQGQPLSPTASNDSVAFVAHTGVLLGHTEVMLSMIFHWKSLRSPTKVMFVSLNGLEKSLSKRLHALDVEAVTAPEFLEPVQKISWLRTELFKLRIDSAVWLSTPCWVAFIFGFGIANRQVLWSLKFHPVHLGPAVKHIAMTKAVTEEVMINGSLWSAFTPPLTSLSPPPDAALVKLNRAQFSEEKIIGTLAREEKFNSDIFIEAIVSILKSRQNVRYLYTGRERPARLSEALSRENLQDRSTFIGWVDTALYVQLLDVFLETFPFGCGVTGVQALSAGTKVISLMEGETLPSYYTPVLACSKPRNWWIAHSVDEYIRMSLDAIDAGIDKSPTNMITYDVERSYKFLSILNN